MARPAKLADHELLERMAEVFRTCGYDGATLTELSQATGLERASLYHRFPGRKQEMALAVLEHLGKRVAEEVLGPLSGPGTAQQRLRLFTERVRDFYCGGLKACVLELFSLGNVPCRQDLPGAVGAWVKALAEVAQQAGLSSDSARIWAEDTVIRIQGSLILARASGQQEPFLRTLREIAGSLAAGD